MLFGPKIYKTQKIAQKAMQKVAQKAMQKAMLDAAESKAKAWKAACEKMAKKTIGSGTCF